MAQPGTGRAHHTDASRPHKIPRSVYARPASTSRPDSPSCAHFADTGASSFRGSAALPAAESVSIRSSCAPSRRVSRCQPLEIPIDPRWSRLTLIDCDSHQNDTAVRQSGSSIGPMSAKTSPGPGLSGWVRPPKCRWIPQTAFNAVCTAPSTQAGVHEMSSPARKMPR
jgi:hypothetical protein